MSVEAAPSPIEREYVYRMSWFTIVLVSALFAVFAVVACFMAEDAHQRDIEGIALTASQARLFYWAVAACFAVLAVAMLRPARDRLSGRPGRIAFTPSALLISLQHWRHGERRLAYDQIASARVGMANWNTYLVIRHAGGVLRLNRSNFPSRADFKEAAALLAQRVGQPSGR